MVLDLYERFQCFKGNQLIFCAEETKVNVKVNCILVQALKLCTSRTAHRESRGIALFFHDHGIGSV